MGVYVVYLLFLAMLSLIAAEKPIVLFTYKSYENKCAGCISYKKLDDSQAKKQYNAKKRNICLIIAAIGLFLLMALRSQNIGQDLPAYKHMWQTIKETSFFDILSRKYDKYPLGIEMGYLLFSKIISYFTNSFQIYIALFAFILVFCLYLFIRDLSPMPFLSIFIFFTFEFYNFGISALRQVTAMAFVLNAFRLLSNKKYCGYIIFTLLACSFHITAIVAFLMPIMLFFSPSKRSNRVIYSVVFVIIFIFREELLNLAILLLHKQTEIVPTGAYNMLIFVAGIVLVGFALIKQKKSKVYDYLLVMMMISLLLMIANTIHMSAGRIAFYYHFCIIAFIPTLINTIESKNLRNLLSILAIVFFLFYCFGMNNIEYLKGAPYRFFWQVGGRL